MYIDAQSQGFPELSLAEILQPMPPPPPHTHLTKFIASSKNVVHDLWLMIVQIHHTEWSKELIELQHSPEPREKRQSSVHPASEEPDPINLSFPLEEDTDEDEFGPIPFDPSQQDEPELKLKYRAPSEDTKQKFVKRSQKFAFSRLHLAHAPCIIYLGCLYLKVPIFVADLHR
jgi:hypothetical protein